MDGYLYLWSDYNNCIVLRIIDPVAPTKIGSCPGGPFITAITGHGKTLYVSSLTGLNQYDVTDPLTPRFWGGSEQRTPAGPIETYKRLDMADNHVVAVSGSGRLRVFDTTKPSALVYLGSLILPFNQQNPYGSRLALAGPYVLSSGSELIVFQHTGSGAPVEIGKLTLPGFTHQIATVLPYVAIATSTRFLIIDLSDGHQPRLLGTYEHTWGVVRKLVLFGTYAYLLTEHAGLVVMDITDPMSPTLITTISALMGGKDLALAGQHLLAVDDRVSLHIFDLATPPTPRLVHIEDSLGPIRSLAAQGFYAYALVEDALQVLDLTDPATPQVVGEYADDIFRDGLMSLRIAGHRIYAGTTFGQFLVIDVADSLYPRWIGNLPGTFYGADLVVAGSFVFQSDFAQSIRVLWLADRIVQTGLTTAPMAFAPTPTITYHFPANAFTLGNSEPASQVANLIHRQLFHGDRQPPAGQRGTDAIYQLDVIEGEEVQQSLQVRHPFTLQVDYGTHTATLVEDSLQLYTWDGERWHVIENARRDNERNILTASLTTLSPWALFGAPRPAAHALFLPLVHRPQLDANIEHLEVTQAIQSWNNNLPLVASRPTMLRVYAKTNTVEAVKGWHLVVSATRDGSSLPDSPQVVGPWAIFPQVHRDEYSHSFNVLLPLAWTSGDVTLSATLQPPSQWADANLENNTTLLPVTFHDVPPLDLRIVPINYTHVPTGRLYPAPTKENLSDYVMRTYPVPAVHASFRAPLDFAGDISVDGGLVDILNALYDLKVSDGAPATQVYYGLLPSMDIPAEAAGRGYIGHRVSVGFNWGTTAAHEIGHNFGRNHAPCGNLSSVDPFYPHTNGLIGEYGVDLVAHTIQSPLQVHDFMSYCGPGWASDYTYMALFEDQRNKGLPTLRAQPAHGLLLRVLLFNGQARIQPMYTLQGPLDPLPAESDYTIALIGEDEQLVIEYPLSMASSEEHGVLAQGTSVLIPTPNVSLREVQLRQNSQVIATRAFIGEVASANASLHVDHGTDQLILRWSAADQPALVRYTNDDGHSWITLSLDVYGGKLRLDPAHLPGGSGRFEVILADQSIATETISPAAALLLPDKPPQAWITGPNRVQRGQPLILFGHGTDLEDGALTTFQWMVNGQPVTARETLQLQDLRMIDTMITLTVTDSAGQQVTAAHYVTVEP